MKYSLVVTLLFFSLFSRAESNIDNVIQFKIASLQLLSSFSAFIYFEGDELNSSRLNESKKNGDKALVKLSTENPELSLKWHQISDYVESSQGRDFDVNLEAGWSVLQEELNHIIALQENKSTYSEASGSSEVSSKNTIIQLHLKMESILSRYMAFANSTLGGYGISSQGIPLEEEITAVSLKLAQLVEQDEKYKLLAKKWGYIEKTLLAYNSNVAPYVVMYTFEKVRKIIASY